MLLSTTYTQSKHKLLLYVPIHQNHGIFYTYAGAAILENSITNNYFATFIQNV